MLHEIDYCQPVYNDLLEYLKDGNILRQLIYLNLGNIVMFQD